MTVPDHPMSRLRGTPEARQLMNQVRAHRTAKKEPMASNFIQQAIKRPGALTAKAKAAGQTINEYANAHKTDKGVAGDESRFYLNVLAKTGPKTAAPAAEPDADDKPPTSEREAATRFMTKRK